MFFSTNCPLFGIKHQAVYNSAKNLNLNSRRRGAFNELSQALNDDPRESSALIEKTAQPRLTTMPALAIPIRQILLSFRAAIAPAGAEPPETDEEKLKETFRGSLSAIEFADGGRTLFLGGDETVEASPSLERLVHEQGARFGGQISQRVDAFFDLPSNAVKKGRVQEIDIEGLAFEGETLWMVGSHSLKRSKPKPSKNLAKNLDRLATVEAEGNRFFLDRKSVV